MKLISAFGGWRAPLALASTALLVAVGAPLGTRAETTSSSLPPSPISVTVANTPLPVQGTVGISGVTPVSQSGTWTVGIAGTPGVLAQPAIPSNTLIYSKFFQLGAQPILVSGPDTIGTRYAVSAFIVTNSGFSAAEGDLFAGMESGPCDDFSTFSTQVLRLEVPAGDSRELTLPVPLTLSPPSGGSSDCLFAATGGPNMSLTLVALKLAS